MRRSAVLLATTFVSYRMSEAFEAHEVMVMAVEVGGLTMPLILAGLWLVSAAVIGWVSYWPGWHQGKEEASWRAASRAPSCNATQCHLHGDEEPAVGSTASPALAQACGRRVELRSMTDACTAWGG